MVGGESIKYTKTHHHKTQSSAYIYPACSMLNRNFCIINSTAAYWRKKKFDGARPDCPCVLRDLKSAVLPYPTPTNLRARSVLFPFFILDHSVRSLYCTTVPVLLKTPPLLAFFTFRKLHICTCIYIHGHHHHHPVAAKCRHSTAPACENSV